MTIPDRKEYTELLNAKDAQQKEQAEADNKKYEAERIERLHEEIVSTVTAKFTAMFREIVKLPFYYK